MDEVSYFSDDFAQTEVDGINTMAGGVINTMSVPRHNAGAMHGDSCTSGCPVDPAVVAAANTTRAASDMKAAAKEAALEEKKLSDEKKVARERQETPISSYFV